MLYLPQQPYLFRGTLKEQVIYPLLHPEDILAVPESEIIRLLNEAGVGYLLKNYTLEDVMNWNSILSPGEQQMISFARLFFHRPQFAVLDEATSSLSEEVERHLYQLCTGKSITLVSVGHRSTLIGYHNTILELDGHRKWKVKTL
jgi:ABC-type uncharacterized transport system fused permease/ATPase subunit